MLKQPRGATQNECVKARKINPQLLRYCFTNCDQTMEASPLAPEGPNSNSAAVSPACECSHFPTTTPLSLRGAFLTVTVARFLVMIGMLPLSIVLAADFIKTVSGVLNDVVPAMALLRSLVYLLASLTVTMLFYVFNRAQFSLTGCWKVIVGWMQ